MVLPGVAADAAPYPWREPITFLIASRQPMVEISLTGGGLGEPEVRGALLALAFALAFVLAFVFVFSLSPCSCRFLWFLLSRFVCFLCCWPSAGIHCPFFEPRLCP